MNSTSYLIGAALLICSIAGGLVYANIDGVESRLADANRPAHEMKSAAAAQPERDQFGCHRHGPVSYHCH